MREFFRGWRRKAGLATLAMALLLMSGWMRSYRIGDIFGTEVGTAVSRAGIISFSTETMTHVGTSHGDRPIYETSVWSTFVESTPDVELTPGDDRSVHSDYQIPYWSLVMPLTLFSAWLLLIKPRPAKSAKESSRA